jgi:hypothetical protein
MSISRTRSTLTVALLLPLALAAACGDSEALHPVGSGPTDTDAGVSADADAGTQTALADATTPLVPDAGALLDSGTSETFPDASTMNPPLPAGLWTRITNLPGPIELGATLLPDGRVFVMEGGQDTFNMRDMWLYDSSARMVAQSWQIERRMDRSKTLLADGRVLITGGYLPDPNTPGQMISFTDAELLDPQSGDITPAGSLQVARFSHTSLRLRDGRVLVAGGWGAGGAPVPSVELYDPASDTFTAIASPLGPNATAVELDDGRVLFSGGLLTPHATYTFDPSAGTFTASPPIPGGRDRHSATLLPDGRVLVAGGWSWNAPLPVLEPAVVIYDPALGGSWSACGDLLTPRSSHTANLLPSGRVLIAGGDNGGGSGTIHATAELCDVRTRACTRTATMNVGRTDHSALRIGDDVYAFGGAGNAPDYSVVTIEAYAE